MFMYNDVFVEYQQRVENDYMEVYADSLSYMPTKVHTMSRIVHSLEVRALDTEVTVTMETGYGFSTAVVISTLLAGLKNIDDGLIYNRARKKMESQLAFEVDQMIPRRVGEIVGNSYSIDGISLDVNIIARQSPKIHAPMLTLLNKESNHGLIEVRLEFYAGVHPNATCTLVDHEIIQDSAAMASIADSLWRKTYENYPMLALDLSFMRYTEGIIVGGKYHKGTFTPILEEKKKNFSGPLHKKPGLPYSSEKDSRVDFLPGVREVVKHPVTENNATLENVIISLNDTHRWTREQIADWLETLDIDITFKSKETNEQN